ncbi:methionyl-tRNA formyltransferase [Microlunatus panaciterrae]|uniref:Methionyl-tRNA formyltransferase n=1 Tax=Microlunatus panaciterrae TaxID=400768 RepID=A0ABS2RE30_9ACTN|nr:methionyl-tRNA formyltransferase [Microlunatus panaciterrae]
MRIVFAGTPEVALPSLNALVESDHAVVAVVTRPDAAQGRGRTLRPSPVAARAAELGIEVLKPKRPRDADFVARLEELAPDCCPVVAYGALIPQHVIDIPRFGWVNLHFSLLPAWRGAAPVQHAVIAGDQVTGACTFSLVAELDAGPVYLTLREPIAPDDTAGALLERLSHSGAQLLLETIDGIASGNLQPQPQPAEGVTFAPKITVADAELDFAQPAVVLDRRIRGCAPAPGAWTLFRGERFKINSASLSEEQLAPGELQVTKRSVRVGTGAGALELGLVQAQGKKPMQAADWARGIQLGPDEKLGE